MKACIRLKVQAEREPVLKQLHTASINTWNIMAEKDGFFTLTFAKKDSEKTFAILKKMCYNYTVIFEHSISAVGAFWVSRMGLVFGTVTAIVLCAVFSLFSFRIDITGLVRLDEDRVRTVLKNGGLSEFTLKSKFTESNVQSALKPLSDILEVSVKTNGGRVFIDVIERAESLPPHSQDTDMLSRYDCVVTKVMALSGEALVKPGKVIKKGTAVIGAHYTDSNGVTMKTKASGEVYGNVVFSKRIATPLVVNKSERTGKTYSSTAVMFRSKEFISGQLPPFESYDSVSETVNAFSGNFIPLKFKRTTFYETRAVEIETDIDDMAEKSLEEFYTFSLSGEKIKDIKKSFKITKAEGYAFIDLFLEAEILVT